MYGVDYLIEQKANSLKETENLTFDEELDLAKRILKGDEEAKQKLLDAIDEYEKEND